MGKYVAGPSLLRFPGRSAIIPGQAFEHVFDEAEHETMALSSGAIALQPGETSLADQIAAHAAAEQAALFTAGESSRGSEAIPVAGDAPAPPPADPAPEPAAAESTEAVESTETTETPRSAPASRRRTRSNDDTQQKEH